MNSSISIALKFALFLLIFAISYYICINFYWVQIIKNLSLNYYTSTLLGLFLFALHISISSFSLLVSITRDGVSLRVIYWFYSFLFMGIAPLMQGVYGIWRFKFDNNVMLAISSLILISHISFVAGYIPRRQREQRRWLTIDLEKLKDDTMMQKYFLDIKRVLLCCLSVFIFSVFTTYYYGFHLTSSMIRSMFGFTYSPIESMLEFFVRPFIFFSFSFLLYAVVNGERRFISKFSLALLFLSVFLIIGPLSGARSLVFFLYFGLFLVLMRHKMATYPRLFGGLLFVGIFGSELQNLLRSFYTSEGPIKFSGVNYFYQGHFDGFEMIAHTLNYIKLEGIVFGKQFLSALLFWVPRSFWSEKSIGSGDFIAYEYLSTLYSVEFANFSMPLLGEAYLNFGILGVWMVFFILGWFCGKEDGKFHTWRKLEAKLNLRQKYAPFWMWRYGTLLGLSLFTFRGDLQSAIAFGSGILLALISAWLLLHGRKRLMLIG